VSRAVRAVRVASIPSQVREWSSPADRDAAADRLGVQFRINRLEADAVSFDRAGLTASASRARNRARQLREMIRRGSL
jgi:hypothetical protein